MGQKKTTPQKGKNRRPGQGKPERYMKPCLLQALSERAAYGYELIQILSEFGFSPGAPPPGMVYRHLRQLEEEGFVASEWDTQEAGPAKRVYTITPDGEEALDAWVAYMQLQVDNLQRFLRRRESYIMERGDQPPSASS